MKFRYIALLTLFLASSIPAAAQNSLFKPFTSLRVIKTEKFDIIFPSESEPSARLLASFADSVYDRVSSLLGIEVPGRIPVTFSPHTGMFNGYYNPVFIHIVLYDTPMDVEWTTYADNLEGLFIHELTHAVSLNTRTPFFNSLNRIFGNWVNPSFFNSTQFMMEGVTVSFESLDGSGRANDPRFKQYLRQAVHEDRFLTPFQASGVYDLPAQPSGYWYEYGGLFSAWLQQTYGMEKYAELWQTIGGRGYYSIYVYRSWLYRIFSRVYGIDFLDAWNDFSSSFALDDLETSSDDLLPVKYSYFSERERFIRSLTARGNNLYYIDRTERKIGIYDTVTGRITSINTDSRAYDIDVSADGTTLLLSSYNYTGDRATAAVTEYVAANGRKTGRSASHLYRARYFRDGVIGIRADLHNNLIVYEDFKGNSEVLFHGNEKLMFSGPQALDDEQIAFIASIEGKRELWLYNYVSKELFRIEDYDGNDKYWNYMRNLSVSEGKFFFSHNEDDRMYKAAYIDLESLQAVFSNRDFSGGVFDPVAVNGNIYYRGAFVERDKLLRFPEPVSSMSGERINLQLVRLDTQNYEAITETSEWNFPHTGETKPYFSLRYMNPLRFWFPIPLVRLPDDWTEDINIKLGGAGIFSLMADPTDRNFVTVIAFADIPYKMAMIEDISWVNTRMGFPLTARFTDKVIEGKYITYRRTTASLSGNLQWNIGQWGHGFSLGAGYIRDAIYEDEKSSYEWEEISSGFYLSAGVSHTYRGFNFRLSGISFLDNFEPRIDGVFQARINTRFPLGFSFFGAYDDFGMDLHGKSINYGSRLITNYALKEYSHPGGLNLTWLAGGEVSLNLFSFEIQRNLSHLYFNRITGALALRNQIYDSNDHPNAEGVEIYDLRLVQSLMLRIGVTTSFFPLVKYPFQVEPYVLGAWKFSNTITGQGSQWYIGFGFNASLL